MIRQKLLESLASERDRLVRNKISDAVADVARQYSENSEFLTIISLSKVASTRGPLSVSSWYHSMWLFP